MTATINASTSAGVVTTADTSGILQLQTNGTAALTVDASQNVGIGTASPSSKLEVYDATSAVARVTAGTEIFEIRNTGSEVRLAVVSADPMTFRTSNVEAMRIDSSGNVGIGATTINNAVTTYRGAGVNNYIQFTNSTTGTASTDGCLIGVAADDTSLRLRVLEAASIIFTTSDTERARILSTGQVLIDRTTNTDSSKVEIYSDSDGTFNPLTIIQGAAGATSRNSVAFYRVSASARVGTITTTNTATAYNTSSDYRLKEAITPMTGALAKVALLKPCTYKWKVDGSDGQGFIAHELDEVVQGCVTGEKDAVETVEIKDEQGNVTGTEQRPVYQGIDTSFLVATLTAAIQELKAIVDAQGAEIAALKGATA